MNYTGFLFMLVHMHFTDNSTLAICLSMSGICYTSFPIRKICWYNLWVLAQFEYFKKSGFCSY